MQRDSNPFSITVGEGQAFPTQDLVFATNFAEIAEYRSGYYNYNLSTGQPASPTIFAAGDSYYFTGTDSSLRPAQSFDKDTPAIWGTGPYPVGNNPAGLWQNWIVSVNERVTNNGEAFLTPPNRFGVLFDNLAANDRPPTGEATAMRIWHKARYRQPDQLLFILTTSGAMTSNRMVYERFYIRFLSAAKASSGVGYLQGLDSVRLNHPGNYFCVFVDHKYNNSQTKTRAMLGIAYNNGAYRFDAYNDVQTGGVVLAGTSRPAWYSWNHGYGPAIEEDVWYQVEFASRPGNANGRGLLWCAIDGQVIVNTTNQTVSDGDTENWAEMMVFQNYQSDEIAGSQKQVTAMRVYDAFSSDASTPHP